MIQGLQKRADEFLILISGGRSESREWIRSSLESIGTVIRMVDLCPEFPDCLKYTPSIIIHDVNNDDLQGVSDIIGRISGNRRYDQTNMILCCLSQPEESRILDAIASGRIEFYRKPIIPQSLSGRIRSILDQRNRLVAKDRDLENLSAVNRELMLLNMTAAHDLKQPLNAIIGFVDLLLAHPGRDSFDAQLIKYIDFIKRSSQNMYGIVMDLLKHTRMLRNPTDELRLEPVKLNELLKEIIYDFVMNDTREIKIEVDPLPTILCEKIWIKSVFKNIIGNGLKYSQSPEPRIKIGCNESDLHYSFFITDNGIGISGEDLEKIFEPFSRLENSRGIEGSGAGLYIVKYAIERHGGRVWAENNPNGNGTTFRFTIPKYSQIPQ
jgi:signal transduction histidine kinase